jgi:gentisate 1,2-dioxygenase
MDRAIYHYLSNGKHFSHTIACQAERLAKGSVSSLPRETICYIYIVQSGKGCTKVTAPAGEVVIEWKPKDVFIVPAWSWVEHRCGDGEDAYLTALTDRAFGENLGLSRINFPSV